MLNYHIHPISCCTVVEFFGFLMGHEFKGGIYLGAGSEIVTDWSPMVWSSVGDQNFKTGH